MYKFLITDAFVFYSLEVMNGENRVFAYANQPESVSEEIITSDIQRNVVESVSNKQVSFRVSKFSI